MSFMTLFAIDPPQDFMFSKGKPWTHEPVKPFTVLAFRRQILEMEIYENIFAVDVPQRGHRIRRICATPGNPCITFLRYIKTHSTVYAEFFLSVRDGADMLVYISSTNLMGGEGVIEASIRSRFYRIT